ncbi:MAG: hypothetical protein KDC98_11685 [Planctomycetes bacterium]|nr:hypothetical protein [Planctomycetota bacterium]
MAPALALLLSLSCALLGGASLPAQQPAPGGGGGGRSDADLWSAAEARALRHLQRLIAGATSNRKLPVRLPPGGLRTSGYRIVCFTRDKESECTATRSGNAAAGIFLLAWPEARTDDTRRGLLAHTDGTTLCCELDEDDESDLEAGLAIGRGSSGKFDDVLRQPGMSTSGHFWLWLQQVAKAAKVELVDEGGRPWRGFTVDFEPQNRQLAAQTELPDGPWPVGTATTDDDGRARLLGPRVRELAATITTADGKTRITTGFACAAAEGGLRFTLSAAAIRRAANAKNEMVAIATLKNIVSAQAQCQASAVIDCDGDGHGEYGLFGELSGKCVVRGHDSRKIQPPVLSAAFSHIKTGRTQRGGYLFQIFLPAADGTAVAEDDDGGAGNRTGADPAIDPDRSESFWCIYAWPADADSGQRAFFTNQSGSILAVSNSGPNGGVRYVGHDRAPAPTAAFAPGATGICGPVAKDSAGSDGQAWAAAK